MKKILLLALFTIVFIGIVEAAPIKPQPTCDISAEIKSVDETKHKDPGTEQRQSLVKLKVLDITMDEKKRIDKWINKEGLNKYGDEQGTKYTGGTPLFNENTGKRMDRIEYIKKQHPDKPWLRNNPCNLSYIKKVQENGAVLPKEPVSEGDVISGKIQLKGDEEGSGYVLSNISKTHEANEEKRQENSWFKKIWNAVVEFFSFFF
ncbi:MAG: hypothetical protein ACOCZ6_04080 [Nanoarchaeota archaeon]